MEKTNLAKDSNKSNNILNPPTFLKIILLSTTKIGVSIYWNFVRSVMLPSDVILIMAENHKELALGAILALMNIFGLLGQLMAGFTSDYFDLSQNHDKKNLISRIFLGNRKPFILVGISGLILTFFLRILFLEANGGIYYLIFYAIFAILGDFFFGIEEICFYALIPESFHFNQIGIASGFVTFSELLGNQIAVVLFGSLFDFKQGGGTSLFRSEWTLVTFICCLISSLTLIFVLFNEHDDVEEDRARTIGHHEKIEGKKELKNLVFDEEDEMHEDLFLEGSEPFLEERNEKIQKIPIKNGELHRNSKFSLKDVTKFFFSSILQPFFRSNNFRTLFIIICAIEYSNSTIDNFFLYYIKDIVRETNYTLLGRFSIASNPEKAQAILVGIKLSFSLFFSFFSGFVSDFFEDKMEFLSSKNLVFLSAIIFIIFDAVLISFHDFTFLIVCSAVFGSFYGIYYTNSLALSSRICPKIPASLHNVGKNTSKKSALGLGLLGFAWQLPPCISVPLGGFLLWIGKHHKFNCFRIIQRLFNDGVTQKGSISWVEEAFSMTLGWLAVFLICISLLFLSIFLILFVLDEKVILKEIEPEKNENTSE